MVLGCANIWVENGVTLGLYGAKYGGRYKKESDNLLHCNLLSLSAGVQDEDIVLLSYVFDDGQKSL